MRNLLASLILASVLLAATASTALMAPVTSVTCSADQGKILVSFIYDDSGSPPLITTVLVDSTDSSPHVVGITFLSLTTLAVVRDLSGVVQPGQTVYNVAPFNQHMTSFSGKYGTYWGFPYIVACGGA